MKKNLFGWLAMATMLVGTGCSSDDVVNDYSPENAIEFGTYVGRDAQGRGTALDNEVATGLSKQGFGVFAYYTNGGGYESTSSPLNYMNNTKVTSTNATDWTYSPVKYWPNEASDKLSFFAYAPHGDANNVIGDGETYDNISFETSYTGDPIINFNVNSDVTNQTDLVVADATNLKDLTKQSVTGKVTFNFKHVLSRVGFKVEAVIDETNEADGTNPDSDTQNKEIADGTVISVQEVELIGAFNNSGKINLNTSAWSNQTAATSTSYLLSSNNSDFTSAASNVTKGKQQLNTASEYMMLIPTGTIGIKIRVKYTVTTTDTALTGSKSVIENNITSAEIPFTFEQGKAYDFVLHLGLTSVKLSASVTEWGTEENIVVNVPMNNN